MSLIANESYPHLSPTLPHLVITPASTCYYASTDLPLHPIQPITFSAPICHYTQLNLLLRKHLSDTILKSTCYYASTYLSLHPTQTITISAPTCHYASPNL